MAVLLIILWCGFIGMLIWGLTSQTASRVLMSRLEDITDLQAEVAEVEQELNEPLAKRTIIPLLEKFGERIEKTKGKVTGSLLYQQLEQAGHPWGLTPTHFVGLKIVSVVVCLGCGGIAVPLLMVYFGRIESLEKVMPLFKTLLSLALAMSPLFGWILPTFMLNRHIKKRHASIRRAIADTVDLVVLGLEAGLGFDGAVGEAVLKTKGPLSDELARCLAEVNHGADRSDSFRGMAERTRLPELSLFVAAIDQAEKMGVGIAQALKAQSKELREKRMMWAREQAAKLPVKMIFPLVFCIFPALFVVILGPAAVQVYELMKQGLF